MADLTLLLGAATRRPSCGHQLRTLLENKGSQTIIVTPETVSENEYGILQTAPMFFKIATDEKDAGLKLNAIMPLLVSGRIIRWRCPAEGAGLVEATILASGDTFDIAPHEGGANLAVKPDSFAEVWLSPEETVLFNAGP